MSEVVTATTVLIRYRQHNNQPVVKQRQWQSLELCCHAVTMAIATGFESEDSKEKSTGGVEMAMIVVTRVMETTIATPTTTPSSTSPTALAWLFLLPRLWHGCFLPPRLQRGCFLPPRLWRGCFLPPQYCFSGCGIVFGGRGIVFGGGGVVFGGHGVVFGGHGVVFGGRSVGKVRFGAAV